MATVGKSGNCIATDALNDYLEWPAVGQVCRITRHTQEPAATTSEVRYGITSLGAAVEPRTLLRYARGHWEIEIPSSEAPSRCQAQCT